MQELIQKLEECRYNVDFDSSIDGVRDTFDTLNEVIYDLYLKGEFTGTVPNGNDTLIISLYSGVFSIKFLVCIVELLFATLFLFS